MTMAIPIDHMVNLKTLLPAQALGTGTHLSNKAAVGSTVTGRIFVDVTDAVGGTSQEVFIEDSPDGDSWFPHTQMNQVTAAGPYAESIENFGAFIRVRIVQAGTFTYGIRFQGKS
jgi:hypothetical protein